MPKSVVLVATIDALSASIVGLPPVGQDHAMHVKTSTELEALFSNTRPELVRLTIDRAGVTKAIEYKTERVSEILMQNHLRLVDGLLVPAELADQDIHCFREKN